MTCYISLESCEYVDLKNNINIAAVSLIQSETSDDIHYLCTDNVILQTVTILRFAKMYNSAP
jgi:hypothetical protein